ncbi:MAG: hypothetical protein AAFQ14_08880 [Cyanobacteria bacterium J06621_12]
MDSKKLIWLGSLIAAIVTSNSVLAQTNQSDTSGGQTFSSPTQQIDSKNGNGISPTTEFNPATGEVIGGGIDSPVQLKNAAGNNSGEASDIATDFNLGCSGDSCTKGNSSQPREVSLNEVADALDAALEQSLDNLAAAENNAQLADAGPRRIARRSAVSNQDVRACVNPVFEARDLVERQLAESEKFIEQVNQIEPQKNIW